MNGKFLLDTNAIVALLTTLRLRTTYNVKLPDAIIAACALEEQATLISNDAVFPRINGLSLMTF